MSLSVIVPTVGRPSLSATLRSIAPQLAQGDEVLVVGDGPQPAARAVAAGFPFVQYHEFGPTFAFGDAQRQFGMRQAHGTHLMFMDDDDVYEPGAFAEVRRAVAREPICPVMFRMIYAESVMWREKKVCGGNVSTHMLVVPNIKDRLGRWRPRSGDLPFAGDYGFITSTLRRWPTGSLLWNEAVIARLVHHSAGARP
jgi:glycosyltransferase involved in cell wall biosynthesis